MLLEQFAAYFYDPAVFWGAPLVLAAAWEIARRLRRRARRRVTTPRR